MIAPGQDEEFVMSHSDNVQATGFVEHLKLPHYVDFQSELGLIRKLARTSSHLSLGDADAFGVTHNPGGLDVPTLGRHADLTGTEVWRPQDGRFEFQPGPIFTHVLFPIYVATLLWGGLYLRDTRLRTVVSRP